MIFPNLLQQKAIEQLYDYECDIIERRSEKDSITKITSTKEVVVLENRPCQISFKNTNNPAMQTEKQATAVQEVKLFISNKIIVKEGSKIVVRKKGTKYVQEFKSSGNPAMYSSHQEIPLKKFLGWT